MNDILKCPTCEQPRKEKTCSSCGLTHTLSHIPKSRTQSGPLLTETQQPKLFNLIAEVAAALNEKLPSQVYLTADVNAWVSQQRGVAGFGSKRIMGIGLPLLQTLSISELKAVLAHEFAHLHSTPRLNTILSFTDNFTARNSSKQENQEHHFSQEYKADEIAATLMGANFLTSGLLKLEATAIAFDAFWQNEVAPIINAGYKPFICQGFKTFLRNTGLDSFMEKIDTQSHGVHPSVHARIDAVKHLPNKPIRPFEPLASSLLDCKDDLENLLFDFIFDGQPEALLPSIEWDEVAETIYFPLWRMALKPFYQSIHHLSVRDFPKLSTIDLSFAERIKLNHLEQPAEKRDRLFWLIQVSLMALLKNKGWKFTKEPGKPLTIHLGMVGITPMNIISRFQTGKLTAKQWHSFIKVAELEHATLGDAFPV